MKVRKAVGVDKVPAAIIRLLATNAPEDLAKVFTTTLTGGIIPPEWKMARLVCLKKPDKTGASPGDYRPICTLPALSKTWEYVIKARIEDFLGPSGLHSRQYVFRRGKSTLDALHKLNEVVEDARRKNWICAVITFDVQNAFNTLPWEGVLEGCRNRNMPFYLQRLLRSYLSERAVVVDMEGGEDVVPIFAGVPQGPF